MRLSAELLESCEQRQNPLDEREIVLRGLAIPTIEHLAVTRDAYDAMDFSDNRLGRLDNFPRLLRLASLNVSGNIVESIDAANLDRNLPNLQHLDLSYNQISSLYQISQLGKACPKLQSLSLNGNSVTSKFHCIVAMLCYTIVYLSIVVCYSMLCYSIISCSSSVLRIWSDVSLYCITLHCIVQWQGRDTPRRHSLVGSLNQSLHHL